MLVWICVLKLDVRIIWDNPELVERIWNRCIMADGINEDLGRIEGSGLLDRRAVARGEKWQFSRLNERMRFLKYGAGQYFKSASLFRLP